MLGFLVIQQRRLAREKVSNQITDEKSRLAGVSQLGPVLQNGVLGIRDAKRNDTADMKMRLNPGTARDHQGLRGVEPTFRMWPHRWRGARDREAAREASSSALGRRQSAPGR